MPKLSLEDFERQERENAREILREYGLDPDHLTPEDVKGNRKLYLLGVLAGVFEPEHESLVALILEAEKDPVLWAEISDEDRAACWKRALLIAYFMLGSERGLSPDDIKFAQALVELHGSVEKTLRALLKSSPLLSRKELLDGVATPATEAESLWVDEYVAQLTTVTAEEWDETQVAVAKFFHDGQAFTCARWVAYSLAVSQDVKNVDEVKDTTFSRTLN